MAGFVGIRNLGNRSQSSRDAGLGREGRFSYAQAGESTAALRLLAQRLWMVGLNAHGFLDALFEPYQLGSEQVSIAGVPPLGRESVDRVFGQDQIDELM
jgi:hypothetical protein